MHMIMHDQGSRVNDLNVLEIPTQISVSDLNVLVPNLGTVTCIFIYFLNVDFFFFFFFKVGIFFV